jgi:hypothetical protein
MIVGDKRSQADIAAAWLHPSPSPVRGSCTITLGSNTTVRLPVGGTHIFVQRVSYQKTGHLSLSEPHLLESGSCLTKSDSAGASAPHNVITMVLKAAGVVVNGASATELPAASVQSASLYSFESTTLMSNICNRIVGICPSGHPCDLI